MLTYMLSLRGQCTDNGHLTVKQEAAGVSADRTVLG